jgi:hypothetical protein
MFLFRFGIFCSSFLSGGAIGILSRHKNMTIGDGLVPLVVGPVAGISTISTLSLIIGNPTSLAIGSGVAGFIVGNIVTMR